MRYIAASTDQVNEEMLKQIVSQVIEEGSGLMPTLVEQWLERGRQEGLERGRQEGLEAGLEAGLEQGRETALELLRRFLTHRFGAVPKQLDEALSELDLESIRGLSEAAFEVESLADFETALVKLLRENQKGKGN